MKRTVIFLALTIVTFAASSSTSVSAKSEKKGTSRKGTFKNITIPGLVKTGNITLN